MQNLKRTKLAEKEALINKNNNVIQIFVFEIINNLNEYFENKSFHLRDFQKNYFFKENLFFELET